jgi:hypothetical protein
MTVRSDYIRVADSGDFILALYTGWNFISAPGTLAAGADTASIFRDIDTGGHSIWQYDAGGRRWTAMKPSTKVEVLDGIWIYSKNRDQVALSFSGNPLETPPTKICLQGWNAIGFSSVTPAETKDTLLSLGDDWTTLIGYDASKQQHEQSIINGGTGIHSDNREMQPGDGYWLYMVNDGELAAIGA